MDKIKKNIGTHNVNNRNLPKLNRFIKIVMFIKIIKKAAVCSPYFVRFILSNRLFAASIS